MYLPQATTIQNSRSLLRNFGGLNETYGCSEAEYSEGMNWCSRNFPALSTRQPRRKLKTLENVNGLYHLNGLLTITGTTLTYEPDDWNTSPSKIVIADAVTDDEKQMVGMGTKILIWPDKKQFDTASGELSGLGAKWVFTAANGSVGNEMAGLDGAYEDDNDDGTITYTPCDENGKTIMGVEHGTTLPDDPSDGDWFLLEADENSPWADTSTMKQYSYDTKTWTDVAIEYCRIEGTGTAEGLGKGLREGDMVTLSNIPPAVLNGMADDLEGEATVYDCGNNFIVVHMTPISENKYRFAQIVQGTNLIKLNPANASSGTTMSAMSNSSTQVTIERRVPDLDYIAVCDNRVWGCSSAENVLYACKLGDATNWFCYQGIASDSYAVTVGSDGTFTGAASCMSYVLFFKENTLHKVYGTKPSDFQVSTLRCRGVAKGAAKSLCVINEALYYLSAAGVMTWSGSLPTKISAALDPDKLANATRAVGGTLDGQYYLQIDTDAGTRLLVYDTERSLWHEETAVGHEMASTGRQLYFWDGESLWAALPEREKDSDSEDAAQQTESGLSYDWTSGDIGLDNPDDKYISRITVRMDAEAHSTVHFYASYDGGSWEKLGEAANSATWARLDVPMIPARHDTMRLRIQGTGRVTLRSIAFTFAASRGKIVQGTK